MGHYFQICLQLLLVCVIINLHFKEHSSWLCNRWLNESRECFLYILETALWLQEACVQAFTIYLQCQVWIFGGYIHFVMNPAKEISLHIVPPVGVRSCIYWQTVTYNQYLLDTWSAVNVKSVNTKHLLLTHSVSCVTFCWDVNFGFFIWLNVLPNYIFLWFSNNTTQTGQAWIPTALTS